MRIRMTEQKKYIMGVAVFCFCIAIVSAFLFSSNISSIEEFFQNHNNTVHEIEMQYEGYKSQGYVITTVCKKNDITHVFIQSSNMTDRERINEWKNLSNQSISFSGIINDEKEMVKDKTGIEPNSIKLTFEDNLGNAIFVIKK